MSDDPHAREDDDYSAMASRMAAALGLPSGEAESLRAQILEKLGFGFPAGFDEHMVFTAILLKWMLAVGTPLNGEVLEAAPHPKVIGVIERLVDMVHHLTGHPLGAEAQKLKAELWQVRAETPAFPPAQAVIPGASEK